MKCFVINTFRYDFYCTVETVLLFNAVPKFGQTILPKVFLP